MDERTLIGIINYSGVGVFPCVPLPIDPTKFSPCGSAVRICISFVPARATGVPSLHNPPLYYPGPAELHDLETRPSRPAERVERRENF